MSVWEVVLLMAVANIAGVLVAFLAGWGLREFASSKWFREMRSLLNQHRQAVKDDRASMQKLCRAYPELSRRDLRREVKHLARDGAARG